MIAEQRAELERLQDLLRERLAPYRGRAFLFGSWARGGPQRTSDIDVALEPLEPLPPGLLATLREDLEESTLTRRVDLIDLRDAGESFRARVRREGIPWSVFKKD